MIYLCVFFQIWNHPDILYNFLKKRADDEELDLDLEETSTSIGTPASGPSTPMTPTTPPQYPPIKRGRNSRSIGVTRLFRCYRSITI